SRSGKDRNVATADRKRRVGLFDHERDRSAETGGQRHGRTIGQVIDRDLLQQTLDRALERGGDFAEIFVEDRRSSSGRFDDGRVEELSSGRDRGAGLRVVRGETTGFAHTADLTAEGLARAAEAAAGAAREGRGGTHVVALTDAASHALDASVVLPETIEKERK